MFNIIKKYGSIDFEKRFCLEVLYDLGHNTFPKDAPSHSFMKTFISRVQAK